MATFEELSQSIKLSAIDLEIFWQKAQYDDALSLIDDLKADLEKIEKIVEQRFAGETS